MAQSHFWSAPSLLTPNFVLKILLSISIFSCVFVLMIGTRKEIPLVDLKVQFVQLSEGNETAYQFRDPILAYRILEKLDRFEQVEKSRKELERESKIYFGTHADPDYCKKHRALIVNNPDLIFKEQNIMTSFTSGSLLVVRVIPEVGRHAQPNLYTLPKEQKKEGRHTWREDANNFFTGFEMFHHRAIGHHFSCLSQSSNAIPGFSRLYRKDYISEGIVEYAKSYKDRKECFNFDKFFPETWILYHKEDCQDFFRHLNSPEYQKLKKDRRGIVYMRKIGANAHQASGVFPINQEEEDKIKEMYGNGDKCGVNRNNNLIQYFVYNPLLLNGKKFDFRIYMLIASSNPVMAYYYDGFLRVSLLRYDTTSKERASLITNTALSKNAFGVAKQNGTFEGQTTDELKHAHLWNYQRLEDYLYDKGIVKDRNWLDNYLRPEFRKALMHLVRISQKHFMKKSSVYHLFGLDFMLDANLNLWFIEANARPALEGFSKEMKDHVASMLTDHFEIVYGLMRSRMKRVIQFVNKFTVKRTSFRSITDPFDVRNLEQREEEFKKLTENYFEDEFKPSPGNRFQPIINDNLDGEDRYYGLLREECF